MVFTPDLFYFCSKEYYKFQINYRTLYSNQRKGNMRIYIKCWNSGIYRKIKLLTNIMFENFRKYLFQTGHTYGKI